MKHLALAIAAVGLAYLSLKYNAELYGWGAFFCLYSLCND